MDKKLETPYPAAKKGLPWELKYNYVRGMLTTLLKSILHEIREQYDGTTALTIYSKSLQRGDRVKKMTFTLKDVFKIEGNDIEATMKWWEIFYELVGVEASWLEVTKTYTKLKITNCPWSSLDPDDINNWEVIFKTMITKNINPKATVERLKAMCAGDPYCEYVTKIEE